MAGIKGKSGRRSRYGRPLTSMERFELSKRRNELLAENMEGVGYHRFPIFLDTKQIEALWRLEKIRARDYPPGYEFKEGGPDDPGFLSRMIFLAVRDYLKNEIDRLPPNAPGAEELRMLELPRVSLHGAATHAAEEALLAWADQRFGKGEQSNGA